MFNYVPLADTLTQKIDITPASTSATLSEAHIEHCPTELQVVPYISTVRLVVRDIYNNLKQLDSGSEEDKLTVNVDRNGTLYCKRTITRSSDGKHVAVTELTGAHCEFSEENLTDFEHTVTVTLTEAFQEFRVYATLNGNEIETSHVAQNCTFETLNKQVHGPSSSFTLRQLGKYWLNDTCVYSNELSYVQITLNDEYGNRVPVTDRASYEELVEFWFSQGSAFSGTQCRSFDEERPAIVSGEWKDQVFNVVVCPIRPHTSGQQTLSGQTGEG